MRSMVNLTSYWNKAKLRTLGLMITPIGQTIAHGGVRRTSYSKIAQAMPEAYTTECYAPRAVTTGGGGGVQCLLEHL